MRTILTYLLGLAAVAVGAWLGFPELFGAPGPAAGGEASRPPTPPPVIVAVVERRPFEDRLEALGTARARESVEISANRADHVAAIHFEDGQEVEAGQLLVDLNSDEEQALLAEATAMRVDRAEQHRQIRELFEQQLASQRELDNAQALLAAADARVIGLQAAIGDRQVRAPFAGTLGLRRISEGAYLQPGDVITTLDDLSVMKVDFTIPEGWLAAVRPGMAIAARTSAWPGMSFLGKIVVIDTRLDASTRSATVRAEIPNPERMLRPGMLMSVAVERGEEAVLQVPEEALIPLDDRQFVLRVDAESIARRVQITLGRRRVGVVEVRDGLAVGDRVVVEGIMRVPASGGPVDVVGTRERHL